MGRLADTTRHVLAVALAALFAAACGGARARPAPEPGERACELIPAPAARADTASIVLTSPVEPGGAPRPSNPAERFVFGHAYETLVRVDCQGRVTAGLAASWTPVEGTARWRLVVRDGARFWNGDPVTAADVVASWRATGQAAGAAMVRRLAESAALVDERTLEVTLCEGSRDLGVGNRGTPAAVRATPMASRGCTPVAALGDPEMAVVRRSERGRWPEGTGAYRIREEIRSGPSAASSRRVTLLLEPVSTAAPMLVIHAVAPTDARDLVDIGADLILTDDPALAAYAASRPDVATMPLAWDRTWALVVPSRSALGTEARGALGADPAATPDSIMARTLAFRSALARDAVRADARASEGPYWWSGAASCGTLSPPERIPPGGAPGGRRAPTAVATRVAYRRDEPVARALAERLVALAAIGAGGAGGARDTSLAILAPALARAGARATAVALAPNEFESALRAGSELAFVTALPRRSLAPCGAVERLVASAPWLVAGTTETADAAGATPRDLASAVVPLVDTRLQAVVRRGRLGLTIAWDSTVAIAGPAPSLGGVRP